MAFAQGGGKGAMADINVTPLVDVMLVLLIIFMVTMPIESYPIKIDLPQARPPDAPENPVEPPEPIKLRIDAANQVYWNDTLTPVSALRNMMSAEVQKDPTNQPQLQIQTDDNAEYEVLAKVLAAAKNADMQKIGFVQGE
ncbi:biopolymer transporter ExbD [Lysobacteraceae bacterium NML07-0707]|nr:biopolymer transporter ExbD [Xanthomonadaceae bacterium NML07-0707]